MRGRQETPHLSCETPHAARGGMGVCLRNSYQRDASLDSRRNVTWVVDPFSMTVGEFLAQPVELSF